MAGLKWVAQTAEIATGVTKITLLQVLAPTNQRLLAKEISISFDGTLNTNAPIIVEVLRQSTAGTAGTVHTLVKLNSAAETIQTTALRNISGTQPTDTAEVMGENVHPQGGFTWQSRFGDDIEIAGGTRLGIAVTAAVSVNAKVRMVVEE
jgi:hypothetical protein